MSRLRRSNFRKAKAALEYANDLPRHCPESLFAFRLHLTTVIRD